MILLSALRPVNCLMASIAIFTGIVLAGGFYPALFFPNGFYLIIIGFLICGAGMVINDYYDMGIDKINKPEKYRKMKKYPKNLWLFYSMFLFITGITISRLVNDLAFLIAVFNSLLLIAYSAKLKKTPLIGNVVVSYLVASLFIFGATITGEFAVPIFLSLLAFLSNTGREIVKDMGDVVGDRREGARTLAVLTGKNFSAFVAIIFVFSAISLSPLPYIFKLLSVNYLYVVMVADLLFAVSCFFIFNSPEKSHQIMKLAMVIALAAFLTGVV